jgi:hypothetical protein
MGIRDPNFSTVTYAGEAGTLSLSHSTSPFFVMGFSEIGSQELFAWDWPQATVFLSSASGVARITGVNHHYLTTCRKF